MSTETIYQAIYVHARGELKRELAKQLRRGRVARKPRKQPDARRPRFVDPMTAHRRASRRGRDPADPWPLGRRPHHRRCRRLGDRHPGRALQPLRHARPPRTRTQRRRRPRQPDQHRPTAAAALRGTLTWDQGAEMSEHRAFSIATDMDGLLLRPGCALAARHQREHQRAAAPVLPQRAPTCPTTPPTNCKRVADELNGRPRKALDWDTPSRANRCFTGRLIEQPLRRLLESKRGRGGSTWPL